MFSQRNPHNAGSVGYNTKRLFIIDYHHALFPFSSMNESPLLLNSFF